MIALHLRAALAIAATCAFAVSGWAADLKTLEIRPSSVNPRVRAYDDVNLVMFDPRAAAPPPPLVVFFPGTGGKPANSRGFLSVIAAQGYRVIGLQYNDTPAVEQKCPTSGDPNCASAFRRMRVSGDGQSRFVSNSRDESIVGRLSDLLAALDRSNPDQGWSGFLANGGPNWPRIIVSGLSQGAGMAAFIAKEHAVARVVLFSSPWDEQGPPSHTPAPWLSTQSATPPPLWFAEYHRQEKTAGAIARAYATLKIPDDHIRIFDRNLPAGAGGANPFHGATVRDVRYADDWRWMFGAP